MIANNNKSYTSLSSILLVILKELRLERNIHQVVFAEACGKQASAWSKIESGKSPLSMESFFKVCYSQQLNYNPAYILSTAERYAEILRSCGIVVVLQVTDNESEDIVLARAEEFYKQPIYFGIRDILNVPQFNANGFIEVLPSVFNHIVNGK